MCHTGNIRLDFKRILRSKQTNHVFTSNQFKNLHFRKIVWLTMNVLSMMVYGTHICHYYDYLTGDVKTKTFAPFFVKRCSRKHVRMFFHSLLKIYFSLSYHRYILSPWSAKQPSFNDYNGVCWCIDNLCFRRCDVHDINFEFFAVNIYF